MVTTELKPPINTKSYNKLKDIHIRNQSSIKKNFGICHVKFINGVAIDSVQVSFHGIEKENDKEVHKKSIKEFILMEGYEIKEICCWVDVYIEAIQFIAINNLGIAQASTVFGKIKGKQERINLINSIALNKIKMRSGETIQQLGTAFRTKNHKLSGG
jgi:hypothetical protein